MRRGKLEGKEKEEASGWADGAAHEDRRPQDAGRCKQRYKDAGRRTKDEGHTIVPKKTCHIGAVLARGLAGGNIVAGQQYQG